MMDMHNPLEKKSGTLSLFKEEKITPDKHGANPINPRGGTLDTITGDVSSRAGTDQRWSSSKNGGYYKQ